MFMKTKEIGCEETNVRSMGPNQTVQIKSEIKD